MSAAQIAVLSKDITIAAGADDERYIANPLPGEWKIKAIKFAPATAVAVHATNNFVATFTTNNGAAGADSSAIASIDTSATALVLKTTLALTLSGDTELELGEGDQIKFAKVEGGTGAALDGAVTVYLEKVRV